MVTAPREGTLGAFMTPPGLIPPDRGILPADFTGIIEPGYEPVIEFYYAGRRVGRLVYGPDQAFEGDWQQGALVFMAFHVKPLIDDYLASRRSAPAA